MIRRRASALSRPPTSDLAERDEAIRLRSSDDRSLPPPFPMVFCRDRNPPPVIRRRWGGDSHPTITQRSSPPPPIKTNHGRPILSSSRGSACAFLHATTNTILLPHGSGVGMPELLVRTSHFLSSRRCRPRIRPRPSSYPRLHRGSGGTITSTPSYHPPEPLNQSMSSPTNPLRSSNARPHRARRSRTMLGRMAVGMFGRLSSPDRLPPIQSLLPPERAC